MTKGRMWEKRSLLSHTYEDMHGGKNMKTRVLLAILFTGVLAVGVGTANAITVNWLTVQDPVRAGAGPGADMLIGTGDDSTTGERNRCNFDTAANCETLGGSASDGTYSFSNLTFDLDYSCKSGILPIPGGDCTCAEGGGLCTQDSDCPVPSCGSTDCCPGVSTCEACDDTSISYFGSVDSYVAFGLIDTCQDPTVSGASDFEVKLFEVQTSESLTGSGGGCIQLKAGGPYLGAPCGVGAITSGSIDVTVQAAGCPGIPMDVAGISYVGEVGTVPVSSGFGSMCDQSGSPTGYTGTYLTALNAAIANTCPIGTHAMILCGQTNLPSDSEITCFADALVDFVVIACTDDNANNCAADPCP